MMKYLLRGLALVCVLVLTFSLCGCSFWGDWDMSFLEDLLGKADSGKNYEGSQSIEYILTEATDFYQEPNENSQKVATYYAGYSVSYENLMVMDGTTWAQAEEGWFILSSSKPDTSVYTEIDKDIILTQTVDVFDEPSLDATISSRLEAGKKVHLSQLSAAGTNPWALCDYGWILLDDCYFELEHLNSPVAYGVVRDNDACFYPEPNIYSGVVGTPSCGSRYGLLAVVEIDGLIWAYTEAGWMPTDSIYEEGATGFRPCTATVIDPTPLNVRIAPGTDKEILTTLTYGDKVNILERINYNGSDWGFTGTGWIFMDLTEID